MLVTVRCYHYFGDLQAYRGLGKRGWRRDGYTHGWLRSRGLVKTDQPDPVFHHHTPDWLRQHAQRRRLGLEQED